MSCESLVPDSQEKNESLLLGGKTFLDIYVGNKSIIPVRETFETQYFGPVGFSLDIEMRKTQFCLKLFHSVPFWKREMVYFEYKVLE